MPEQNIEDKINSVLDGDSKKNALDFVAFARANNVSFTVNKDDDAGWAVGGVVGKSLGFMLVNGAADFPGPWTLWFNSCDFKDDGAVDDDLKQTAWNHAADCGRCHAGWEKCGGGDRTMFGKEFARLCHSPLMFTNPDAKTRENMQQLLLMLT